MDRRAALVALTPAARVVVLLTLSLLVLVDCSSGIRPIASLPAPIREQVPVVIGPGEFRLQAVSARVVRGQRYHYEALTHCGFTATTFDFDGSYWTVVGPTGDGQGNPLEGLGNPFDAGTIELITSDTAVFTSAAGMRIDLVRGPSEAQIFGCD